MWRPSFVTLLTIMVAASYLLPARLVLKGPLGAAGRPSLLVGLALLVCWALVQLASTERRPFQPVRFLIGAYLGVWCLSFGLAQLRGLSPVEASGAERFLLITLSLCGIALATADLVPDRPAIDVLLRRLTWAGAFMGFVGFLQFQFDYNLAERITLPGLRLSDELLGIRTRGAAQFNRASGTAQHSIEFGVLSAMLFPIALHYALGARTVWERRRRWVLVGFVSVGIPFSLSRSGVLAFAAAFLVMFRVWDRRAQRAGLGALLGAVVLLRVTIPGLVGTFISFFRNAGDDPSVEGRKDDYELVAELVSRRPLFGLGGGTFRPEEYFVVDNYILNALVATGVVGLATVLLLFAGSFALGVRMARRRAAAEDRHLGTALAASVAAGFVSSFTFDSLNFPTFAGTLFFVVGIIGALHRTRGQPAHPSGGSAHDGVAKARSGMAPLLFRHLDEADGPRGWDGGWRPGARPGRTQPLEDERGAGRCGRGDT